MLTAGAISSRQKWKNILSGTDESATLSLGYYCVKLSDDAERSKNLSRSERDIAEKSFFESTEPWSLMLESGRFGVRRTVADLSKELSNLLDLA